MCYAAPLSLFPMSMIGDLSIILSSVYVETGRSTSATQIAISNAATTLPARTWQVSHPDEPMPKH